MANISKNDRLYTIKDMERCREKVIDAVMASISKSYFFAEALENLGDDPKDLDATLGGYRGGMLATIRAIRKDVRALRKDDAVCM